MRMLKLVVILIFVSLLLSVSVDAGLWDSIKKSIAPAKSTSPAGAGLAKQKSTTSSSTSVGVDKVTTTSAKMSKFTSPYPIIFIHGLDGSQDSLITMQNQLAIDKITENKGVIYSSSPKSQLCPET